MFYLVEFLKSLGESFFRGVSFFLFSCILAFSLTHRAWVVQMVDKISPEKIVNPYFVAVLDNTVDAENLKQVVGKLPGVLAINERSKEEGSSRIKALMADLGTGYNLSPELMDFKTIRISLNPSLSRDSLDFVRSQVAKIGGKEHLNVTEVKYPEVAGLMKSHPFYAFLGKAGDWGIIGLLALAWIISYWLTYNIFRSRSYVIEKFQRKKLVAAKTLAAGLGFVFVLFAGLGLMNGTLKFFDLVILFMVFSVFWTFSMQEWRWKPTL
jgi:hypothetical protein